MSPGAIWVREIARGVKAMGPLEMDHSVWTPVASQVVAALPRVKLCGVLPLVPYTWSFPLFPPRVLHGDGC